MTAAAAVIAVAIALIAPGRSDASTVIVPDDGSPVYQQWVDASILPTPDAEIRVSRDPALCASFGAMSCTWYGGPIVLGPDDGRRVFLHELGHHFDYAELGDEDRAALRALAGDEREWRSPPNSPHEAFAEAYSWLARFARPEPWRAGYLAGPLIRQRQAFRALVRRAAI